MKIRHEENYSEISSDVFGASISVYRPRKPWNSTAPIEAGYINASTWGRGDYAEYMLMMGYAVHLLNEFNAIIPEWTPVENPIREIRWVREELEGYKKREAEALAKKNAKKKV